MGRLRKPEWSQSKRKDLQKLLLEGYTISTIADILCMSNASIYNEIRRGTSEDEYKMHQYIKYTPEKVVENFMKMIIGEDIKSGEE